MEVEVGIVYEGDGHLAEDATVTASLTGPAGLRSVRSPWCAPVATTSLYAVSADVTPGDWSVKVTSTDPPARSAAPCR